VCVCVCVRVCACVRGLKLYKLYINNISLYKIKLESEYVINSLRLAPFIFNYSSYVIKKIFFTFLTFLFTFYIF